MIPRTSLPSSQERLNGTNPELYEPFSHSYSLVPSIYAYLESVLLFHIFSCIYIYIYIYICVCLCVCVCVCVHFSSDPFAFGSLDSSDRTVSTLRVAHSGNRISIPSTFKGFIFFPKGPGRLSRYNKLLFSPYWKLFRRSKAARARNWPLTSVWCRD
jgi:hypothetical protein